MKTNTTTDNRIYIYAVMGSLLFILAFGFTIANLLSLVLLEQTSTVIACVLLGVSSLLLLYKAIKTDRARLR